MQAYKSVGGGMAKNPYYGLTDEQIATGPIHTDFYSDYSAAKKRYDAARQSTQAGYNLDDWKANVYPQKTAERSIAWGGGYVTPAEYSKIQMLNKDKLTSDYQTSYNEAKAANESRYNEILSGYDKLMGDSASKYESLIANQAGMGNAEKADLMHNYEVLGSRQQQGLVNSGLSSTTIRPAVQAQNTTAMQRALSLVNERLQGQTNNLQLGSLNNAQDLTQNKFGVMERRTDDYPNQSMYLELLKQYGNA